MDTGRDLIACWEDRSGTRVADDPVVKASLRQQESQTPTQWCGKGIRLCPQTSKGLLSWGRLWGIHTSSPEFCRPRQRSTRFCSAGFLLCKISSVRGFCCCFVLPRGPTISFGWCNTMRTCGTVPRSCWTSKELRGCGSC